MTQPLSPRMTGLLTWLARENRPVNVANREATIAALVRRGMLAYVPNPAYGQPVIVTEAGHAAALAANVEYQRIKAELAGGSK